MVGENVHAGRIEEIHVSHSEVPVEAAAVMEKLHQALCQVQPAPV